MMMKLDFVQYFFFRPSKIINNDKVLIIKLRLDLDFLKLRTISITGASPILGL